MSRIVRCEHCHKNLKVDIAAASKFKCPSCGGVVDVELASDVAAAIDIMQQIAPLPGGPGASAKGRRCPNCGQAMDEGAVICLGCGFNQQSGGIAGEQPHRNVGLKIMIGVGILAALVVSGFVIKLVMGLGGTSTPRATNRPVPHVQPAKPAVEKSTSTPISTDKPFGPIYNKPLVSLDGRSQSDNSSHDASSTSD